MSYVSEQLEKLKAKNPNEPEFIQAIRSHPGIADVEAYAELFLDHPNGLPPVRKL